MSFSELSSQLPEGIMWEERLKKWEQTMPQQELGIRLSFLLHELMPPTLHPLLESIEKCYRLPEEALRWTIFEKAQHIGFNTPVGALALALFWSLGSMSPIGLEPVYPSPNLSSQILHCVLVMSVTALSDIPEHGMQFIISHNSMTGEI